MLQLLSDLVYPLLILLGAAAYAGLTLVQAVVKSDVPVLTSLAAFRDRAFANFWRLQGAWSYKVSRPHVAPLLPRAKGRVLDIGTGTGHWLEFYDRTKLTRLYAVEPNGNHHAALWQKARKAGLQDVFEVLSAPVEALQSQAGIGRGSIDTVVTVQVLCSIPEPEAMVRDLYSYLKPGGQWIVYEHVRTPSDGLISYYQAALNFVWPSMLNGCSLTQDSAQTLKSAGPWTSVNLRPPPGESSTSAVPHVLGLLKK